MTKQRERFSQPVRRQTSPAEQGFSESHRASMSGQVGQSALVSLSENGGLMRSPEPPLLGSRLSLSFELPRSGLLELDAEIAYQLVPDVGVIFNGAPPSVREAISAYVTEALGRL